MVCAFCKKAHRDKSAHPSQLRLAYFSASCKASSFYLPLELWAFGISGWVWRFGDTVSCTGSSNLHTGFLFSQRITPLKSKREFNELIIEFHVRSGIPEAAPLVFIHVQLRNGLFFSPLNVEMNTPVSSMYWSKGVLNVLDPLSSLRFLLFSFLFLWPTSTRFIIDCH